MTQERQELDEDGLGLVPRPVRIVRRDGSFEPGPAPVLSGEGIGGSALEDARGLLSAAWGRPWRAAAGAAPDGRASLTVRLRAGLADEGYILDLAPEGALLEASTEAGIKAGINALRALALVHGPTLPACRIEDEPRFGWRGFMLDCARSFFRVEFVERMIDLASLHRLNRFHWHLSDDQAWRLDLAAFSELAAKGSSRPDTRYNIELYRHAGSYSEADVARVVAYASARGVEIIPEIELPGHVTALLASHPELACVPRDFAPVDRFGIFEDVLCLGNDGTLGFVGRVLDEVARLFPGRWLHAGGDEVRTARWEACPRCRSRAETLGVEPSQLQGWFTREVARLVLERGKVPAFWDEALDAGIPAGSLAFAWQGPGRGHEAARRGIDAVMCPMTAACYLDHKHLDNPEEPGQHGVCTVADSYSFEPAEGLSAEDARRVLGVQANLWTEIAYFGRQAEYQTFPRLSAVAEVGWTAINRRDFASFGRRLGPWGAMLDRLGVNRYRGPLA
ncbi:MAG: beta-N-acetylhexosaminidase [Spirochaetales bacterium]|nr:beta-N-acetylhexosaminidase [Spirochaetales bacterium]